MLIRDVDRSYAPRPVRGKVVSPLRKTAEGLGVFLDRLSEAVRDKDSVDRELKTSRKGTGRGFKWDAYANKNLPPVDLALNEEQTEVFNMLRDARNIASDASSAAMSLQDRGTAQEKLKAIFNELSAKRVTILSSMLSGADPASDDKFYSLMSPDSARTAYNGIDEMIMKFLSVRENDPQNAGDANAPYIDHGAAMSAVEQLREFLLAEGPAKAFARFREINRSSVLGLLQD